MIRFAKLFCCLFTCFLIFNYVSAQEKLSFNKGWKFYQGDIPFPEIQGHTNTYSNAKAGKAWGAAAPEYNDQSWRSVILPHDWAVEGGYDSTQNVSQGYRKRGIGWYRRHFKLSNADRGKHLEIQFDGIATHATVWFNGTVVHRNWCGYTSFYIDITSMAKYGDELNTIAIRVDANAMEGWWYEGAGIYRHTWLLKRSPIHIATDGVFAHPVQQNQQWTIPVEVTVENHGTQSEEVIVESKLFNAQKIEVATASKQIQLDIFKPQNANYNISVLNPLLWSVEHPNLYTVVTTVKKGDKVIDELTTKCGFRTIRFDKDSGFYLNNVRLKLQGVCNHQDHAGVGVALPDALWEFRLRKLKEMGVNAYRCSHNPPSNEFLNLCDSMGILVLDENRNFNASPEYVRQLEWMIKRDRNHPSIILWSVFNEEPMQGTEQGYEMVRRMSAVVKQFDTTRPVTAAMNGGLFSAKNVSKAVDVVGFNYQINSYDKFHKENPNLLLTSSEDGSAYQVRGEYQNNKQKNILNAYDTEAAPWGATHRNAWKAIAERPFLAGGFYWTGFDYRGEPTPFTWPSASSFFGIMDVCGFPKAAYWIHQAQWRKDIPVLQIVPHWNWPSDSIGKMIKVMAMSNTDSIKLLLNGKMVGAQKVDKYEMNSFQVAYKPGKLEVIGYKNGKEVAKSKVETTDLPVAIQLVAYKNTIDNNGTDAMPVTVRVVDAKGREVPTAQNLIEFSINENATIIGLGNGDPNSHELEKGNQRSLFNGLAQVIIQSKENTSGVVVLTASAKGLQSATLQIPINRVALAPFVPLTASAIYIDSWRMSPFTAVKPDATITLSDNDMNSWFPVKSNELQSFANEQYALFTTNFTLNDVNTKATGKIILKRITGKAEVWLNNVLVGKKDQFAQGDIQVPFESMNGSYKLTVLIESEKNKRSGLGGTITVMPEITSNK